MLVALLAACSSPARPAVVPPGQVAVVGDSVFRTGLGGAIAVTVTRSFEGQSASGAATLLAMDLETAKQSVLVRVAAARAWLAIADALAGDPPRRYAAVQRAVDELGTEYRKARPTLIDDTGKHLQLARILADQGDPAGAADEARRTVQSRLALYHRCFPDHLAAE